MSRYYTQGAGRPDAEEEEMMDRVVPGGSRQVRGNTAAHQPLRDSYYDDGEERDQGFDVRADFDGAGPRWSEMYGVAKNETYRPVYDHDVAAAPMAASGMDSMKGTNTGGYDASEMVSVPVLGPEWGKGELHDVSRRGQDDIKAEKRRMNFRAWSRDQRGMCGISWMTRTVFVFIAFAFIVALILVLYFTIPRAVTFTIYDSDPLYVDNSTLVLTRTPTNFSFSGELHLLADSSSSWIPVQFSNAVATVYDLETMKKIATGNLGKYKMAKGNANAVRFPINFAYEAVNTSDTTWTDMYNACQYPFSGVVRATLNFRVEIVQSIVGLVGHPMSVDSITGVTCPFQFSSAS